MGIKSNGSQLFCYLNIGQIFTTGAEAGLHWTPVAGLTISGGYQLLYAKNLAVIDSIKAHSRAYATARTPTGIRPFTVPLLTDGQSVVITDLPGDTAAATATDNMADTGIANFQTMYFSFTTNAKANISDSAEQRTLTWDLAFAGPFNVEICVNCRDNSFNPGYGRTGQGADSTGSVGLTGYPSAGRLGWYNYNQTTHILTPIPDITLIIRTAAGKYAKLAMVSLYQNDPANPTLSTPVPYLTFKYWVQQYGSTNLSTE